MKVLRKGVFIINRKPRRTLRLFSILTYNNLKHFENHWKSVLGATICAHYRDFNMNSSLSFLKDVRQYTPFIKIFVLNEIE